MEEILEIYRQVMAGTPNNTILSYDNINLHFSGGAINLYDYTGEMPCGRYRLPPNEQALIDKINELNEKIGDMTSLGQFICGKCGGTFDLPESTKDRHGAYICESCHHGGDIRKPVVESKKTVADKVSDTPKAKTEVQTLPTTTSTPKARLTAEEAIQFLKDQGYVIRKSVKSFKVVAQDYDGNVGVTETYYRSKEDFEAKHPKLKFISIVKELHTSSEEPLDS